MKNTSKHLIRFATWLVIALAFETAQLRAQTAWTNTAGGNWNTPANWNPNAVPDVGTNAIVTNSGTYTITYNAPMAAAAIGILTNGTPANMVLNISAAGFNVAGNAFLNGGAASAINVITNGVITNATLNVQNQNASVNFNGGAMTNAVSSLSNNGSNDGGPVRVTNGIANLGNVTIRRSGATAFSSGLTVQNPGLLVANTITVGTGNSFCTMSVGGGAVSIAGALQVAFGNAVARQCQFVQTNGTVTIGDVVSLAGTAGQFAWFTVNGQGVLNANGIVLFTNPVSSAIANLTNGGTIYLGSGGILLTNEVGNTNNISLNDQGTFGATADWTANVDALLRNGVFTFKAADAGGTPHNITMSGGLRGTGSLNKTGGGTLTLNGTNVHSGNTLINAGALVLGATGTISNSAQIIAGSGTILDVSAVPGGFILNAGQTLGGSGIVTGAVTAVANAVINPGSNTLTGALSFANGLTEPDGVVNHFDLSNNPLGPSNDLVSVTGDFTVAGTNTVQVSGSLPGGSTYKLIQYSGNFNGDITNFVVTGATGIISNSPAAKAIYLLAQTSVRGPTSIGWVGNAAVNDWDLANRTNWSNAGSLDFFVSLDNVGFDDNGGANPLVNVVGSLTPSAVTVAASSNYTFAGIGAIAGTTGLTKTNTGTLTVLVTNTYSGPTFINGGVLAVSELAPAGSPSSIGAATADPLNLVLNNGTLRSLGVAASTDRGLMLNSAASTIDVPTNGSTLTLTGPTTGTGTLNKAGDGELALNAANGHAGGVVVNTGTLTLLNANGAGTGGLTNNTGTTLRVQGTIIVPNVYNASGVVTVDLNNSGGDPVMSGDWSGNPFVVFTNQGAGRTFTMGGNGNGGGSMNNFAGTLLCGNNPGFFRVNNGGGNPNTGNTNLTLDLGVSTATFLSRNGAVTVNIGRLLGGASTSLSGRGNGAAGTVTYAVGAMGLDSTFSGTIKDGGNATALAKVGAATLTLDGASTHTGATTVSNGVLALLNGGAIDSSSLIRVFSPGILDVSGRTDASLNVGSSASQTLQGDGVIRGSVVVGGAGTISPGSSIGTLTVTNQVTFGTGSTAVMELNRAGTPNSDTLVAPAIVLGGTLVVTNVGANLQVGDTFDLFDGSLSGGFDAVVLPNYYTWNTNSLTLNGTVSVTGFIPPPFFSSITTSGFDITLVVTNGAPNGPLVLLSSTNVALPLSSWTALFTNQFDGSGNFTVSDPLDPEVPAKYYRLLVK